MRTRLLALGLTALTLAPAAAGQRPPREIKPGSRIEQLTFEHAYGPGAPAAYWQCNLLHWHAAGIPLPGLKEVTGGPFCLNFGGHVHGPAKKHGTCEPARPLHRAALCTLRPGAFDGAVPIAPLAVHTLAVEANWYRIHKGPPNPTENRHVLGTCRCCG